MIGSKRRECGECVECGYPLEWYEDGSPIRDEDTGQLERVYWANDGFDGPWCSAACRDSK